MRIRRPIIHSPERTQKIEIERNFKPLDNKFESGNIEMERNFKPLDDKSESGNVVLSFSDSMFKLREFIIATEQAFQAYGLDQLRHHLSSRGGIPGNNEEWYKQGVDCELLKPGTEGWKKGKIRIKISLELCLDESEISEIPSSSNKPEIYQPESPLDDLRRMIN